MNKTFQNFDNLSADVSNEDLFILPFFYPDNNIHAFKPTLTVRGLR